MNKLKVKENGYILSSYTFKDRENNLFGQPYYTDETEPDKLKDIINSILDTKVVYIHISEDIFKKYDSLEIGTSLCVFGSIYDDDTYKIRKFKDKTDVLYHGVLPFSEKMIPLFLFTKGKDAAAFYGSSKYNPQVVIKDIKYQDKTFHLFDDSVLPGGTKQRGLIIFLSKIQQNHIIYVTPITGFMQVSLAYVCKVLNKKLTIYTTEYKGADYTLVDRAKKMYPEMTSIRMPGKIRNIEAIAISRFENDPDSYVIPFGGRFNSYMDSLYQNLNSAVGTMTDVRRLWCVSGSGATLNVLYDIFPDTKFFVVMVGRKIYDDVFETDRTVNFISKEFFGNKAEDPPPYEASAYYEAKMWKYVKKYGKDGDYIWNVH